MRLSSLTFGDFKMSKPILFVSTFAFLNEAADYDVWAGDAFDNIDTYLGIPLHQALALIPNEEVRSYWEDVCPDFGFSVNGAAFIRIGYLNYHSSELIPITYGHPLYGSYDYIVEFEKGSMFAIRLDTATINILVWVATSN